MRKTISKFACIFTLSILMSSCYTLSYEVGDGAQTGIEVKKKNHYVVYGLAGISTSDPTEMAGSAENYNVKIEHSFIDGLINAITFGIYTPTTTTVTK